MNGGIYKALRRLVLFFVAAALCSVAAAAQDTKPAPNASNAASGASIPSTTPLLKPSTKAPQTPPPGRLRGVTNNMRWAAAIRTQDRKAHVRGKAAKPAAQSEVKK